jgi:pyridoxamine 5'-phosphate oxidase
MIILERLRQWIEETKSVERYADTMALATATASGIPSVRMVSLRGFEANAIRFYTGLRSRKAKELAENPHAAALFFFPSLRRQVRLEGHVEPLDAATCDAHFRLRPRGHRLSTSAWVQGTRIDSLDRLREARAKAVDGERPDHWGGFRLVVEAGELWIGGDDRMHERLRFEGAESFRLAP